MLRLTAMLVFGSAALAATASAQKPQKAFFPYPLRVEKLKNGLVVVRVPFRSPGLVAYRTVVRVGSRNEVEPLHTGFAHFFEHVMFKGTKRFPEGAREKLLATLGFNDNAFTQDDMTVYHSFGPSSGLQRLVDVEGDRFRNLEYSEATFQTEAKAVLGEYHKSAANPELKIEEELEATAFTQHPYRHTTLGFYDDIQKMPGYYEFSLEFFRRWYTPDNALLFVVGDFDDAKLMQWIRESYGPWRGKVARVRIPSEPRQTSGRQIRIDWPTPTLPRVIHAWHTPASTLSDRNAAVQAVLGSYLVGPSSPLQKELVLEKHLAEGIGTRFFDHRDPHLFSIQASLIEESTRQPVEVAFEGALWQLAVGEVDAQRVEDIKRNLRYGLLMALETADQVAEHLANSAGIHGVPNALEIEHQNIARVRPADLVAFVKRYLTAANRTSLTLMPSAQPQSREGKPKS